MNYLLSKYATTSNKANVQGLAYLAHQVFDSGWAGPEYNLRDSADPQLVPIRAKATALLAEATRNAGPYTTQPVLVIAGDGVSGTVRGTQVKSAAGNNVAGTQTATLTGPAVFPNGTKTMSYASGTNLTFKATGNGKVWVNTTTAMPGNSVRAYDPAGAQKLIVYGGTANVAGRSGDVVTLRRSSRSTPLQPR